MALFKFDKDDIFINTLIAYPETSFYIVSGNVYLDNMPHQEQTNADVPDGYLSLYELNNDKIAGQKIYPELFKDWQRQKDLGSRKRASQEVNWTNQAKV